MKPNPISFLTANRVTLKCFKCSLLSSVNGRHGIRGGVGGRGGGVERWFELSDAFTVSVIG
jgi:hypothetical protein